jgi:hypothetical protein
LKHLFKAMWKSYDAEFQGLLQGLERHKDLVERRATVDQYRRHKEDMIMLKTKLDDQIAADKLKKLVTIREWLAVGQQPADDHAGYQKIRQDYSTTTKWILEHSDIKKWIEDPVPTTPRMRLYYEAISINVANKSCSGMGARYSWSRYVYLLPFFT